MEIQKRLSNIRFENIEKSGPLFIALIGLILVGALSVFQPLVLALLAFASLYLLLAISRFEWVLLLTIFAFPLVPLYVGFDLKGMVVVNPQRVLIIGLYIAWALKKIYRGEKVLLRTPLNFGLAVFLLVRLFGIVFSIDFGVSLSRYLAQFFTFYLFYFLLIDSISSKKQIDRVLRTVALSAGAVSFLGILEFVTKFNFYSYLNPSRATIALTASQIQSRMGLLRIEGALGHSIVMGMFLALIVPICLGQFIAAGSKKGKTWLLGGLLISAAAGLTFSRATWIGLGFILIAFALRYPRHFLPYVSVIIIGATVTLFGLSRGRDVRTFVERTTESAKKADLPYSTAFRVKQIKTGWPVVLQRPLTGHGIDHAKKVTRLRAIDNYYLTLMLESGIPSLFAFLFLLSLVFSKLKRVVRTSPDFETRNLAFSIFISLASFVIILGFVSLTQVFFIWWVLAAMGMRTVMNESQIGPIMIGQRTA